MTGLFIDCAREVTPIINKKMEHFIKSTKQNKKKGRSQNRQKSERDYFSTQTTFPLGHISPCLRTPSRCAMYSLHIAAILIDSSAN